MAKLVACLDDRDVAHKFLEPILCILGRFPRQGRCDLGPRVRFVARPVCERIFEDLVFFKRPHFRLAAVLTH